MKGDLSGPDPVLVRMHAVDLLDDMTGGPHWIAVHNAMDMIAEAGRGAVVLIRDHRRTALSDRVRQLAMSPRPSAELRDYGIGAQILLDLGVKNMVLLSNRARTIIGLEGYGLNVVDSAPDRTPQAGTSEHRGCRAALRPPRRRPAARICFWSARPTTPEVVDGLTAGRRAHPPRGRRHLRNPRRRRRLRTSPGHPPRPARRPPLRRLRRSRLRRERRNRPLRPHLPGDDLRPHAGLPAIRLGARARACSRCTGSSRPWPAPVRMGTTKGQRPRPQHWCRSMQPAG